MGDSNYKSQPDLIQIVKDLTERIRDLATQNRTGFTALRMVVSELLTLNGAYIQKSFPQELTLEGSVIIDATKCSFARIVLTDNVSSTTISNGVQDQLLTIMWVQDSFGGKTYVWPTNCRFAGSAPTSTTANSRTSVTFVYDVSNWYEVYRAVGVSG